MERVYLYHLNLSCFPWSGIPGPELLVYMRMEYTNPPLETAMLLANLKHEGLAVMHERKDFAFLDNYGFAALARSYFTSVYQSLCPHGFFKQKKRFLLRQNTLNIK